jgi:hypothetical protein
MSVTKEVGEKSSNHDEELPRIRKLSKVALQMVTLMFCFILTIFLGLGVFTPRTLQIPSHYKVRCLTDESTSKAFLNAAAVMYRKGEVVGRRSSRPSSLSVDVYFHIVTGEKDATSISDQMVADQASI